MNNPILILGEVIGNYVCIALLIYFGIHTYFTEKGKHLERLMQQEPQKDLQEDFEREKI